MDALLKVLHVDAASGFYKVERFRVGEFWGPVDLGLHLAGRHGCLCIGTGLFAGSIFPGSNRLVFSGFSPCWGGFYVSSMGGAGLVFENLGINLLALRGKAATPSILCLNRAGGEEIEVELVPVDARRIWDGGRGGVYAMIDEALRLFAGRFAEDPRVLATGPAALATDIGAVASVPVKGGKVSLVDTWAGRGGFGSKMLREHGVAAVVYGGTFVDDDFRDRKVADEWFERRYNRKLAGKDVEATIKYRFDPKFETGGTFGVNYAKVGGQLLAFNYRSVHRPEEERAALHRELIVGHYLKQFNEETIRTRSMRTCGEPCAAVCKKMKDEFKKDYEPYQTMGPLCGIFDQRAAEKLNHRADALGFDGISVGGVLAWLMELLHEKVVTPAELGAPGEPVFASEGFRVETDSMTNADIGVALLDGIAAGRGFLDMGEGARKAARRLAREKGRRAIDPFVYVANARRGWMVPNQYWTPGVLAPMPIMGKYYMHYGAEFVPPRELGRKCADRMVRELMMDNAGFCRFHRNWVEEMLPDMIGALYGEGMKGSCVGQAGVTAGRIASRNSGVFWETERTVDFVHSFLRRRRDVEGDAAPELLAWLDRFGKDRREAALDWWFEVMKGAQETLLPLST